MRVHAKLLEAWSRASAPPEISTLDSFFGPQRGDHRGQKRRSLHERLGQSPSGYYFWEATASAPSAAEAAARAETTARASKRTRRKNRQGNPRWIFFFSLCPTSHARYGGSGGAGSELLKAQMKGLLADGPRLESLK